MIKGVLVVNNHGKPRMVKFFEELPYETQQRAIQECWQLVSKRSDSLCNFLEGGSIYSKDTKLIYRHYATLYFIFIVDGSESELGILDLIQVFVETLDRCFENVCELDLIFHSDKVHYILDEIVMGGMVLETNKDEIYTAVADQQKLEAASRKDAQVGPGGAQSPTAQVAQVAAGVAQKLKSLKIADSLKQLAAKK